jgi:hypothetical protein
VVWRTVAEAEGVESLNSSNITRLDNPMKLSKQNKYFPGLFTIAVFAGVLCHLPLDVIHAADQDAQQKPAVSQRTFASPDEAIKALRTATEGNDKAALTEIFGPEFHDLRTGDEVQDANNAHRFAAAMAEGCNPVNEAEDRVTLEVGTNSWPMPIPLVKADGQWHFDTAAGKEEVINRHIGKDELCAIGVCRAYVAAQRQYASMNPDGETKYARKFKSTPGKKDGLYWPVSDNESASPFGPLVAEAHAEGYVSHSSGTGPHPFHGYYFRILTRQGSAAPGGKMNYISDGNLTGGFALVAYPEHWDRSGIMTFIVAEDGKVFQRNLGEKTSRIAGRLKEYNPDTDWTLVDDEGIATAVSEK